MTIERPMFPPRAESAGPLYVKTDIPPEQIFQAIGRLRKEARAEIDRLIRFLDKTDDYVSRELEDDDDREQLGDDEPPLGSFDRMMDQTKSWQYQAWRGGFLCEDAPVDAEHDEADAEPSLGSLDQHDNQEQWANGSASDREHDGSESGIADLDGLLEQIGSPDWQGPRGGMA
jgi:hypothetical protein